MSKISRRCSLRFSLLLFLSSLLQLIPGLADSSPSFNSENGTKAATHNSSKKAVGLTVVLVCLGILATVAFCVFLFKVWQKKRREAQQARLLKLFEEDDELEVELGKGPEAQTFGRNERNETLAGKYHLAEKESFKDAVLVDYNFTRCVITSGAEVFNSFSSDVRKNIYGQWVQGEKPKLCLIQDAFIDPRM